MDKSRQSDGFPTKASRRLSINGCTIVALLSIKPFYAQQIIQGIKRYEFRRTRIRTDLSHIIIYCTSPIRRAIAVAEVDGVESGSVSRLWANTRHAAGISESAYRHYFQGKKCAIAISIRRVIPFTTWVSPDDKLFGFRVPRSFSYVEREFLEKILGLGLRSDGSDYAQSFVISFGT